MIKFVFKIGVVLVAGVLTYNYFLGDAEEKKQSEAVFSQIKDLGSSIGGLIKSEKEKFDQGKYDEALAKISSAVSELKNRDDETGGEMSTELAALEAEKTSLEAQSAAAKDGSMKPDQIAALYEQLQGLIGKTQSVSETMASNEETSED